VERKARFASPPPELLLTVNEPILAYYKHAAEYYGFTDEPTRGDASCLRDALRILKVLSGSTPAREFGPLALKACRGEMLRKDWSRTWTNAQVDRIRRAFRWGVEEDLVPGSVYEALRTVKGLRRGKGRPRDG
jgi:hypothetical protein